jgi:hypothetical protein
LDRATIQNRRSASITARVRYLGENALVESRRENDSVPGVTTIVLISGEPLDGSSHDAIVVVTLVAPSSQGIAEEPLAGRLRQSQKKKQELETGFCHCSA